MPIEEASEKFLAFSTPQGHYAYHKLPMGLPASPEFFSKVLNKVLAVMDSVLIYANDIVICIRLFRKFLPFFWVFSIWVFRTIECGNTASWPAKMALSLCVSHFFNTAYITYYVTFHLINL